MTKIKICGITKSEDAILAGKLGAWAVGFIFVKQSKRYIKPENVSKITAKLSDSVEKIGIFVNSPLNEILETVKVAKLTKIQLHGEETPNFCSEVRQKTGLEVIKAIRVKNIDDIELIDCYKGFVDFILLDSYSDKEHGGTGQVFNWDIALKAKEFNVPIILAGGINIDNISDAIKSVNPYAVDISSGVEVDKGIKDHNKLRELFELIK